MGFLQGTEARPLGGNKIPLKMLKWNEIVFEIYPQNNLFLLLVYFFESRVKEECGKFKFCKLGIFYKSFWIIPSSFVIILVAT